MKCQILFFGKHKKNITNLSSAELAKRVVKVKQSLNGFLLVSCLTHFIAYLLVPTILQADSESSDQTGWMHRLILAIAVRKIDINTLSSKCNPYWFAVQRTCGVRRAVLAWVRA